MISVEVCVGSACHVKGSYSVISKLQELITDNELGEKVEVKTAFCFGNCASAVSVHFAEEETIYSVAANSAAVKEFFREEILKRTNTAGAEAEIANIK